MEKIMISDIARLLRISPEAVRFYERKKIVEPERNEENSYRYFSQEDLRRLYDCRIYQSLGFSLNEIIDIATTASEERVEEMIANQEKALQEIISENTIALDRIRRIKEVPERVEQFLGKYHVVDSPHSLIAYHSENGILDQKNINHKFWDMVTNYYNLFVCSAKISPEIALDPNLSEVMACGFSCDYETGINLGLEPDGYVKELKPQLCVYTMFRAQPVVCAKNLEPIFKWMERHNYTQSGDIICHAPKITFDKGVDSRLYEVWVPIEEI